MEPQAQPLDISTLMPVIFGVLKDNPQRVSGWIREEAGCWGFLAGQAVAGCKNHAGRSLSEGERRWVWHRLWQMLEQLKIDLAQ